MTHLDLFSGIGGFALAAKWAGFQTVQFVEIDAYCQKVLAKNFPGVPIHDDVRTFRGDGIGGVDLLTGGFPCQDVSDAGLRAGIEGERSGLWTELHRAISEIRPRFVVVENVTGLLRRGMGKVLGDLSEIGYDAEWSTVSACSMGAPHSRERVFIICYPARCDYRTEFTRSQAAPVRERWLPEFKRGHWWDSEPGVCRVADGIPSELDCIRGIEDDQKRGAKSESEARFLIWQILREMWLNREVATASPDIYAERLRDYLPEVSHARPQSNWFMGQGYEEDEELRDLWTAFCAQSFQEAQDLQSCLLERIRQTERKQTLARKHRLDRLRGLGNAIVPQVAYPILQVIADELNVEASRQAR